ncbi:TIR domain-containing protein [Streptomyces sp. BA2]|uniref:TIR domain-containing protein n=1 Tax=Streptomyces sp. BA2 TaxID=436595 RepID=UPI0013225545|nr:TIR domain-containing protein [Streptomyces sp. BA2]MWA11214.1 hypothetical protein [Streptomyces sp. BA2]
MSTTNQAIANELARRELRRISESYAASKGSASRHKCFLSYHGANATEVLDFVNRFENVFIPRVIGITEDDPAIQSENSEYIMDTIREKYLSDSTVTILMVGACTWSRKIVDWEIYSSLRRDRVNRLNGVMGIRLPSTAGQRPKILGRFNDNLGEPESYARYWSYPDNAQALQTCIQDAFDARSDRASHIVNTLPRMTRNSACP